MRLRMHTSKNSQQVHGRDSFPPLYKNLAATRNCLLKPSPAPETSGHGHQLGLAYCRETWAYTMNTVLANVTFLLLLDTNLSSQAGVTHYSLPHDTTASY